MEIDATMVPVSMMFDGHSPDVLRQGRQWQAACQNGQFGCTRLRKWLGQLTFAAGSPWYSNVTSPQRQLPLAITIDSSVREK